MEQHERNDIGRPGGKRAAPCRPAPRSGPRPIDFIENKPVDFARIEALLAPSRAQNHYTNFGPVSQLARRCLLETLEIPDGAGIDALFCCSGTAALNAAAGALSIGRGRDIRWAVSANGFYSTRIGPFTDAIVVDCDARGLVDIDALRRLDHNGARFEGVVFTNLFGFFDDFDDILAFCRDHGKALIIDNAASLGSMRRLYGHPILAELDWVEIFSFHQTKPWGLGEGGAGVFPAPLAEAFERMINFGIDFAPEFQSYATNGKISEVACAMIVSRLETMPARSPVYRAQAKRILAIGRDLGLVPLADGLPAGSVPGHVPFLAPRPVAFAALRNNVVVLQKYYRPLSTDCPRAVDRYARTLSMPCHGEVGTLPDASIRAVLARYA